MIKSKGLFNQRPLEIFVNRFKILLFKVKINPLILFRFMPQRNKDGNVKITINEDGDEVDR